MDKNDKYFINLLTDVVSEDINSPIDWNIFLNNVKFYLQLNDVNEGLIDRILEEPELIYSIYVMNYTSKKLLSKEINDYFTMKKNRRLNDY